MTRNNLIIPPIKKKKMTLSELRYREIVIIPRELDRRRVAGPSRVFVYLVARNVAGSCGFSTALRSVAMPRACLSAKVSFARSAPRPYARSVSLHLPYLLHCSLSLSRTLPRFFKEQRSLSLALEWMPRMRMSSGPYSLSTEVPSWHALRRRAGIAWHRMSGSSESRQAEIITFVEEPWRRGIHRVTQWIFQSVSIYRVWIHRVCLCSSLSLSLSPILSCTRRIRRKISPFHPTRSYISGYHYTRCHSVTS